MRRLAHVSRLLFLLACYHCGIEAGRYISLERIIEDNKARYYEVLEQSSHRWHEGKHDPWPTLNFLLFLTRNPVSNCILETAHERPTPPMDEMTRDRSALYTGQLTGQPTVSLS